MNERRFVEVGREADLEDGELLSADIEGTPVVVVRVDGTFYAIGGICTHEHALLAEGEVYDCRIVCPLHGSEFDLRTGAAVTLPATEPEPIYDVKIEDGKIFVSAQPRR